jgi:protoporphyrinogen oxidase
MNIANEGKTVIIGAGPAGISCAYTLAKAGAKSVVIDKESMPGGLCRTLNFHGYLFDIGGHRFLSKSEEINQFWREIIGDELLTVNRLSRIYYQKKYFNYPLSFFSTFWKLGPIETFLCFTSYLSGKALKPGNDETFEGWIINRFGKRLFEIFFKTYTEKVWAVKPGDISADWAAQRIRGLSLKVAVQNALLGFENGAPKTLTKKFLYPRTGPGEFYLRLKEKASALGAQFDFGKTVVSIKHDKERIVSIEAQDRLGGRNENIVVDYLFSSMPLPILVKSLDPQPPEYVIRAAQRLHFRSLLVVNIILDREKVFPDQWIYVHSPEVKLGRIQNYKNWSPAMVIDSKKTSIGLEYFCSAEDDLWKMNDIDLIDYSLNELERLGIASRRYLINGFVVRCPNVYPIYSLDYKENVGIVKKYLERFSNMQTIGRGGLFRYDNSDHAMLTGIYAAQNFLGKSQYDLWGINADDGYLES